MQGPPLKRRKRIHHFSNPPCQPKPDIVDVCLYTVYSIQYTPRPSSSSSFLPSFLSASLSSPFIPSSPILSLILTHIHIPISTYIQLITNPSHSAPLRGFSQFQSQILNPQSSILYIKRAKPAQPELSRLLLLQARGRVTILASRGLAWTGLECTHNLLTVQYLLTYVLTYILAHSYLASQAH
ncbi:hypothetical protein DL98DRAFT_258984 [Cadophora sp. DSE1049]|nr:hypothetical protein DL98DRAFT_258984 [Cadophora sp. DSE1049]